MSECGVVVLPTFIPGICIVFLVFVKAKGVVCVGRKFIIIARIFVKTIFHLVFVAHGVVVGVGLP